MSIHDKWDSETASDWVVTPSTVKLQPVKKAENNCAIVKMDDDRRLVFGWASISVTAEGEHLEDLQHDLILPEDLEEAVYEYVLHFRDSGEEHRPHLRKKGKLVESCVFTAEKQKAMGLPEGILPVGWWIGFKIEDDEAWEKVKNGTYRMFSIEGKAQRVPVEKAAPDEGEEIMIPEHEKTDTVLEVTKFNPYHDSKGRFTSANSAASFTYAPGKSKAHDNAIAREKQRQAGAASAKADNEPKEDEYGQKHGPLKKPVSVGMMDTGTGKQVEYRVTGITQMKGDGYDHKSCRAEFKWKDKWVEVKNANSLKLIRQKYDSLTPDEYQSGISKAAPAEIAPTVTKSDPERFDYIEEFDFP